MRLWSLWPGYLDSKGLVALWREGLLARAVLAGKTRGYRNHPQLQRFREAADPLATLDAYLWEVVGEAGARGFQFDASKLGSLTQVPALTVTDGQLRFEWGHLLGKLERRDRARLLACQQVATPQAHPLFLVVPGPVEPWERGERGH